ncbi:tetratricopeptide repeat protein [Marinobacter sp. HN1S83]|uniref:tetratricopeptide repeat protein n=1 Tax=Marinobacter sp. HN1S83 TaxID=3382301 RepID=UPI00387B7D72
MARRKPSFFSLPALLLMGFLFALVLYVLFPRQSVFEDMQHLSDPDAVSIAYFETLLKSDPDNVPLRINLGRMQRQVGQLDKARTTLAPLLEKQRIPSRALESYLELLVSQYQAAPEGDRRELVRRELSSTIDRLLAQSYSAERKQNLALPVFPLLSPARQLSIQTELFSQSDGRMHLSLGKNLAREYEALGRHAEAISTLESVSELVPQEEKTGFTSNLIRLELAAGRPEQALARFRASQPATLDADQLRQGIRLAELADASEPRQRWLGQLAALEPDNLEVQRDFITAQLARGDINRALIALRRIEQQPEAMTREDRRRAARILEWNGYPEQALSYWRRLYRESGSETAFERATALARELFRWEALTALLSQAAANNTIDARGFELLADSLVRNGRLDEAGARLDEGMKRFPNNESLRERKITLLINRRRFPEAIRFLQAQPSLTDAERIRLARLYWRIRDPESALAALDFQPSDPKLAAEASAIRLELGAMLGQEDILQTEYERLSALPFDELDASMQEQMINLAVRFNDYTKAATLAEIRFEDTGDPRYLAATAEYQLSMNNWDQLESTLERWRQQFPEALTNARFWTLTALLRQQQNRNDAAQQAFREAVRLAPYNTEVLISWSWFLMGHPERLPGPLPELLKRLSNNPPAEAYSALAYGYQALGDSERALAWARRGRSVQQNNPDWLLAMAPLVEQNDARAEGSAYRRQSIALGGTSTQQSKQNLLYPSDNQTGAVNEPLYRFDNRALQTGLSIMDLGEFGVRSTSVSGEFSHDHWRWYFNASDRRADARGRLRERPELERDYRIRLQNNSRNTLLTLELGQLSRFGGTDTALGAEIDSRPADRISLNGGIALKERTPDSAEAWWLTARDRVYASARYTPVSRLELAAGLEGMSINDSSGDSLATGYGLDATGTYTLFREDPGWAITASYRRQQLDLADQLGPKTSAALSQPLQPGDLVAETYERVGIRSRWFHGEPHALYRTTPEPHFFVGLGAGYVLSTSSPDFGVDLGLGWRVIGDDSLSLSAGYTSDGLDGSSRTNLNLTYTLFFGR